MQRLMTRKITLGAAMTAVAAILAGPATASACPDANKTPSQLTSAEARESVTCLINKRRKNNGLGKLRIHAKLQRAAQRHSNSMDAANYFDHYSPGGSGPVDRIQATGYMAGARSWGVGENIRWGSGSLGTPRVAVEEWMRSSSHRRIMLSGSYRQVGIGVAIGSPEGGAGNDAAIYTADFGFTR
jgi:uncharacterized protein YkwD